MPQPRPQPTTASSPASARLKARLRGELRWLRLRLAGHALLMLLAGVGLLLAAAVATRPGWAQWGPGGAWLVWGALGLAVAWVLLLELWRPLRAVANLKGFSRSLERHGPFGNLLEAATQFSSRRKADPLAQGASPELVEEILRRAGDAAERTRLAPRVPLVGAQLHVLLAVVALAAWGLLLAVAPGRIQATFDDLAQPRRLYNGPPTEGLWAEAGDRRVPVGADVELRARDYSAGDGPVVLELHRGGDFWQQVATEERPTGLSPSPFRQLVVELPSVEDPLRYRFRKGDLTSATHRIEVQERPVLRGLAATFTPPAYSGRPVEEVGELSGVARVLEGTRAVLRGTASRDLAAAWRLEEGGDEMPLAVEGAAFTDTLVVEGEHRFRLRLVDTDGLESRAVTVYHLSAEPDDPPTVEVTEPAGDSVLGKELRLLVGGVAADDVGLARLDLLSRRPEQEQWQRLPLYPQPADSAAGLLRLRQDAGEQELTVEFVWDLGQQDLLPGDALLWCLEATDNNALEGGQSARSLVYRLRLPTVAEVFEADREQRGEQGDELAETLSEGEELHEDLERLARELKKDPDPDWAKQQEIAEALERQLQLRQEMERGLAELQRQAEEFRRENAGSLELLQKMEAIQELLAQLMDEDAAAALRSLQERMEQMLPHELQGSLEEAREGQEDMNERLDRTLGLLEQLERERRMSDLVEETADQLQRQRELLEEQLAQRDPGEGESQDEAGEPGGEQEDGEPQEGESPDEQAGDEEGQSGDQDAKEGQDGKDAEEQARAQERLAEQARELEQRLEEALQELRERQQDSEQRDPTAEQMEEALEQALEQMQQEGRPSESMEDAQEQLQRGDQEQSEQSQQEALERLLSLYEVLAEGQEGMQLAEGRAAVEKLQQVAFDLLQLSHAEETLLPPLRDGIRGQRLAPLTREQGRIARSVRRIDEDLKALARQNVRIPQALMEEIDALADEMEGLVERMQLGRPSTAARGVEDGMGRMNQTVMNLLTAARQQSQGQGQGQQQSATEKLRQMGKEQSRLNAESQRLGERMRSGGLSPSERQQLAELMARQQALRQQMQELQQQQEQQGDDRRILGDMGSMAEEMEEIEGRLGEGRLGAQTRQLQDQILSRLLQAQRSVRQREMDQQRREGTSADELWSRQDGELGPGEGEVGEAGERLRRWQAPEKAPPAYRDEVRRYFRRVQEELRPKGEGPAPRAGGQ